MTQRTYEDPILELATRFGDGPEGVLDLADVTDIEAETVLAVLDEADREEKAAAMTGRLRAMGHVL
jgi:hypothetical protein